MPLSQFDGGDEWKKRRRFFQTNLMTMLNKQFVDTNIKLLINQSLIPILNELENTDKLWFCHEDMQYITFNGVYCCIFGGFLKRTDESYKQYVDNFKVFLHELQLQVLRYLLLGEKLCTLVRHRLNEYDVVLNKQNILCRKWAVNAHKNYDKNNRNTYYDHVYHELSDNMLIGKKYDDIITDAVIADMEVAIEGGTDTSAATLEYCICVAAKYPKLQDEIYEEIIDNIGDMKEFNLLNKIQKFHKLRAFVFEVFRCIPVVPNSVFRQIRKKNGMKVKVDDNKEYIIPNNSIIITNIIGMQMNPNIWRNPDEFNINRWLNDKGKFTKKQNPQIMNFTFGLRDCPGKALALKTIYLVIAILFSKYRFYYDEPDKVQINLKMDFVLHVHPQIGCKVIKR